MFTVTQSPSVVLLPNQAVAPQLPSKRDIRLEMGDFVACLALTEEERMAAYRLRFLVFNLEMNEGLESAYADGYDKDHFDDVCDHMIVEDRTTGAVVGTYRMQMGEVAGQYFGYYSEQEFCFAPYEGMRSQIVELGRACIHREYRSSDVLHLHALRERLDAMLAREGRLALAQACFEFLPTRAKLDLQGWDTEDIFAHS